MKELGIATLTSCFINANRDSKADAAKPSDFYYFQIREESDRISIPAIACDTFFALIKDGLLPGWVVPLVPVDKLEAGRKRGEVGKPRAWVGEGVILIAPKIEGGQVIAAIAVTEAVEGTVEVMDVDSGETFEIVIPDGTEHCWILDADFNLSRES
ncbi:hypothetical protein H6F90_10795 [Trichocoleus sp. FACHB-591]|uniref:hypothetical protein n=1 Tax=Trichocoleus sp. FACHB-591 TaxID=2692872 RepID=UPI00168232C5|nr:hypothetical protein [Trichocoleus sp. FACHB-591]MBD2095642.1 hypothetical protein [Trichocoleus sp. FACHB-591]